MTQHGQGTPHGHQHIHPDHHRGHGHDDDHDSGLADLLDLDAAVLEDYLSELTAWIAGQIPQNPRTIIDVGAGTGTGTLALARRFPSATIHAIDRSAAMLGHIRAKAQAHDLETRIQPVQADLDQAWPGLPDADLVWAVSSLHELADPDRVLRDIQTALAPGALLAVVEMDSLPRYLPRDLGFGRPGLEDRCHAVLAASGWNDHPDWSGPLAGAGYDVVAQRRFDLAADPAPAGTGEYAAAYLGRIRQFVEGHVDAEDLATLDRLLDPQDEASLTRRSDLVLSGTRTAWLARKA